MPASMKHVISVPWTDDERALLRQMWANGIGCTGIGRHLGAQQIQRALRDRDAEPRAARELVAPPAQPPGRVVLARAQPKPLPANARTLPPLPSELTAENSSHG